MTLVFYIQGKEPIGYVNERCTILCTLKPCGVGASSHKRGDYVYKTFKCGLFEISCRRYKVYDT